MADERKPGVGAVDAPIACEVLVVGAGGAGMYAAIAAARAGADVLLLDKSMVGRGGATIMAQMTVAAAIGHQEPDNPELHLQDTITGGKGLCDEEIAGVMCREGPERILEMEDWGVGWAKENGHIKQVQAPGHSRQRCCYVDILNTGPAVASTMQAQVRRQSRVRRMNNIIITDVVVDGGRAVGAVGLDIVQGHPLSFQAGAVILAGGGLTTMYARNSASSNMTGDATSLALRAGAELMDMEFVQFFPIAHLAPRLVGMDPIMWDPFRYKLGGKLLNGQGEDFLDRYGAQDGGKYTATRDIVAYGIIKENEAGRGTPAGGAYLDFRHIPEDRLRAAFGPVIDRLLGNGIDLTRQAVEVAPMAHYHMGGARVNTRMETRVPGLYVAGEAVAGVHGANRLSGNGITECFVFGERAGRFAAEYIKTSPAPAWNAAAARPALDEVTVVGTGSRSRLEIAPSQVRPELKRLMWEWVGPLRTSEKLHRALNRLRELEAEVLPYLRIPEGQSFNLCWQEWFELRAMLDTGIAVATAALARQESRGAQQREDFPDTSPEYDANLVLSRRGGELVPEWLPVMRLGGNTAAGGTAS